MKDVVMVKNLVQDSKNSNIYEKTNNLSSTELIGSSQNSNCPEKTPTPSLQTSVDEFDDDFGDFESGSADNPPCSSVEENKMDHDLRNEEDGNSMSEEAQSSSQNINKQLDRANKKNLASLVQSELPSLSKYWLAALKDHALLLLPTEYG